MDTETKKEKAIIFLKNNIRAFIKDSYDNYYFCDIKEICPDWVIVKCFQGNKSSEIFRILWIDMVDIQEYNEGLK